VLHSPCLAQFIFRVPGKRLLVGDLLHIVYADYALPVPRSPRARHRMSASAPAPARRRP
jgi:hypothetical protein